MHEAGSLTGQLVGDAGPLTQMDHLGCDRVEGDERSVPGADCADAAAQRLHREPPGGRCADEAQANGRALDRHRPRCAGARGLCL